MTILKDIRRVTATDHRRNTQLTRDDRRMAGTSATVCDNRRGFLHDRFPIRVGHVSNQHVTLLNTVHFADVVNDFDFTGTDAMADSTPFHHHRTLALQRIALHHLAVGTDGFRTCLHDKQFAGMAILRPLNVHRALIVLLDQHRLGG